MKEKVTKKDVGFDSWWIFSLYINSYLYISLKKKKIKIFPQRFYFLPQKIAGKRTVINPEVPFLLIDSAGASQYNSCVISFVFRMPLITFFQ